MCFLIYFVDKDSVDLDLYNSSEGAGVVSNKATTDFDKDSPNQETVQGGVYLFSFTKSKNYSTNRSQFVIFVTPEIIESAATGVQEIERKFRKRSR